MYQVLWGRVFTLFGSSKTECTFEFYNHDNSWKIYQKIICANIMSLQPLVPWSSWFLLFTCIECKRDICTDFEPVFGSSLNLNSLFPHTHQTLNLSKRLCKLDQNCGRQVLWRGHFLMSGSVLYNVGRGISLILQYLRKGYRLFTSRQYLC